MSDRIVLLGTGTCQIESHRIASSVLVEIGRLRVVYDFGPGVLRRLFESGYSQNDIEHIVISHFHPDHVSDLIPFCQAACWSRIDPRHRDLHLYGPRGLQTLFDQWIAAFGSGALLCERFRVHIHEITEPHFQICEQSFIWTELPPAHNHGLKFTHQHKIYAVTGDSEFHETEVKFLQDVDLAIIDAGHLSKMQIMDLACRTQVPRIICSHIYEELDGTELNLEAGLKGYRGEIVIGEDCAEFLLENLIIPSE